MNKLYHIFLVSITICSIVNLSAEQNNKDCNYIVIPDMEYNPDVARRDTIYPYSWFFIDTISPTKVTVITDSIGTPYAYIGEVNLDTINPEKLLSYNNFFVLSEDFARCDKRFQINNPLLCAASSNPRSVPMNIEHAKRIFYKNRIKKILFIDKPKYYGFVMMRGEDIIQQCFPIITDDKVLPQYNFKDTKAYYKMLVPVW